MIVTLAQCSMMAPRGAGGIISTVNWVMAPLQDQIQTRSPLQYKDYQMLPPLLPAPAMMEVIILDTTVALYKETARPYVGGKITMVNLVPAVSRTVQFLFRCRIYHLPLQLLPGVIRMAALSV